MNPVDSQQRSDAAALLNIARQERLEYIKLYTRLQTNVTVFVDRSNHELAALALTIRQKEQNIENLEKIAEGYMVKPGPAVIAEGQTFAPEENPNGTPSKVNGVDEAAAEARGPARIVRDAEKS